MYLASCLPSSYLPSVLPHLSAFLPHTWLLVSLTFPTLLHSFIFFIGCILLSSPYLFPSSIPSQFSTFVITIACPVPLLSRSHCPLVLFVLSYCPSFALSSCIFSFLLCCLSFLHSLGPPFLSSINTFLHFYTYHQSFTPLNPPPPYFTLPSIPYVFLLSHAIVK